MSTKKASSAKRALILDDNEPDENIEKTVTSTSVPSSPIILETPQKKRSKIEEGEQSKGRTLFASPQGRKTAIVTPPKDDGREAVGSKGGSFVPTYIHKNLSYKREGEAALPSNVHKSFHLIKEHFSIPDDFEQNHEYGPLSGTCFEERVIRAYNLNLLRPKAPKDSTLRICSNCAMLNDHKRVDCPELL